MRFEQEKEGYRANHILLFGLRLSQNTPSSLAEVDEEDADIRRVNAANAGRLPNVQGSEFGQLLRRFDA